MSFRSKNKRRGPHRGIFLPEIECKTNSPRTLTTLRHKIAIQRVLNSLKAGIGGPLTLGELAILAGLSRTYFSRVFKEIVGTNLKEYVAQIRIRKAKYLLRDLNLMVKEISYEAGFKDPDYFCRIFKKTTGTTPTDWRLKKLDHERRKPK